MSYDGLEKKDVVSLKDELKCVVRLIIATIIFMISMFILLTYLFVKGIIYFISLF